ncbi:Regulatory protein AfsR [Anaerolineales bacterium]|nr:Regulatory protein AfsR [Anaerolineales bacterium]
MPFSPSSDSKADFVLITALPEERDALLDNLPGYRQLPPDNESIRNYFQADLPVVFSDGSTGTYRVIVMCLLGMGRIQAATATADAIRKWQPRYIILVGIAGGIEARDVRIGDILISDQIIDYELQKLTSQGPEIRWEVLRADPKLLDACRNYRSETWQESIQIQRPRKGKPRRHTGPIASGDKVIAFGKVLARYRNVWPKLIGVEMEAAGAAMAAFQSSAKPGFFMIRGVSDLADENKGTRSSEKWRPYACAVAAAFIVALLRNGPIPLYEKSSKKTQQVELILEGEFDAFSLSQQRNTIDVLAALLKIDPGDIRILEVRQGSIALLVEMPRVAASRLHELAINRDFRLKTIGLESLQVEGRATIRLIDTAAQDSNNILRWPSTTSVSGGVNVDAERDVNIHGDVVGRDKISNTHSANTSGGANIVGSVSVEGGSELVGRDKIEDNSIKTGNIIGAGVVVIGHGASASVTIEAPAPLIMALHQPPQPPQDFTGRKSELAQLVSILTQGVNTGIALYGLGGVGKSALALTLAKQLAPSYPDAQFYLNLKGTTQPMSTAEAMVRILRAYYPTSKLADREEELSGQYQSILYNQRALFVFDDADGAEQIERLMPPAGCAVIVTSRHHFTLPGLFTHGLDTLPPEDANALLTKIAPRIGGLGHTIAKLCGYLPLALRVAASTLATHVNLDPADYLRKLTDKQKRLELVEASIGLSYELLPPDLRQTWCKLSIFPDSFDEKAAAAVLELKPGRLLDVLGELVKGSLVEWNDVAKRYRLHDLVRLFAQKRLSKDEQQAAHQRAGQHYKHDKRQFYLIDAIFHLQHGGEYEEAAQLAVSNTSIIIGRGQSRTLRSLLERFKAGQLSNEQSGAVHISLGQVCTLLGEEKKAQARFKQAIAQAGTLSRSSSKSLLLARAYRGMGDLLQRESPPDALKWLQRGLQQLSGRDAQLEADMRIKVGTILMDLQKYTSAQESVELGMKLLLRGPSQLRAAALLNLSEIHYRQGHTRKGQQLAYRALKISAQLRDDWMMLRLKINMGVNADIEGNWSDAVTAYQDALELATRLGDVNHLTMLRINLGLLRMNMGDYAIADDHLQKGLKLARSHDYLKVHLANLLCNIADLDLRQSQSQEAMPSLLEAEHLAKEMGLDHLLPEIYRSLAQVYLLQQELRKASTFANKSVKLAEEFGDAVEMGKSLRVLGQVQWANNQHKVALDSFERSLSLLADHDPYESARTKAELGQRLKVNDELDRSIALMQEARATFQKLGAERDLASLDNFK